MIPTVQQVFVTARSHCGDTAVSGGQIFKDAFLQLYWPSAYEALYRWLERNSNKRLRRTVFFKVPAYTTSLSPADIGIPSLGKPENIWDRPIANTFAATIAAFNAASTGVPSSVDLTVTGHGLSNGAEVVTYGFGTTPFTVSDDINGQWYVSVVDANTLRLLGCSAVNFSGGVGSAGVLATGSQLFGREPLTQLYDIDNWPLTASNSQLSEWKWENGAFRFVPSTTDRQIKIVLFLSGTPPTGTVSVGIDDSLDALSLFLGAAASQAKGFGQKSAALSMRAVGNPNLDTTHIVGGAFYELAQLGLQEMNQTRVVLQRYRPRRNVGPIPVVSVR